MRRKLTPLRGLSSLGAVVLFVRVVAFALVVPALMRLPLPRLSALIARGPRRPRAAPPGYPAQLEQLVTIAQAVGSPVVRPGCLTRGVTLCWFLRRAGVDVELCFGMDPRGHDPAGHCWLVRDGAPFLEAADPRARFAELYRVPLAAAG